MVNKLITKHYRWVLSVWVIIFALLGWFAIHLPEHLRGSGFDTEGKHKDTKALYDDLYDQPGEQLIFVFQYEEAEGDEWERYRDSFTEDYAPNWIKDEAGLAIASFGYDQAEEQAWIEHFQAVQKEAPPAIKLMLTGGAILDRDMSEASQRDLIRAEMIGVPVALVILIWAFGSLVASLIPIIMGVIVVVCAMGLLYLFTGDNTLSVFLLNIIPMLGLALGIDFALLSVHRFREEYKKSQDIDNSIAITQQRAGRAILFSGLCVFIGLGSMLWIPVPIFHAIAYGGMAVVFFSVLVATTFLPALFKIIGPLLERGKVFKAAENQQWWRKWADFVIRNPWKLAALTTAVLLFACMPLSKMTLTVPGADTVPEYFESRQAYDIYQAEVDPKGETTVFALWEGTAALTDEEELASFYSWLLTLEEDVQVLKTTSIFQEMLTPEHLAMLLEFELDEGQLLKESFIRDNYTFAKITLAGQESDRDIQNWLRERDDTQVNWFGYAKFTQEMNDTILTYLPYSIATILIATYVILFLAFKSVIIPIKAILMNMLSLGAAFGFLTYVYHVGWLAEPGTTIALVIPIMTFCVVFGLSMDYEVFLISRMREIYLETGDNDLATREGLVRTSRIITSAAGIVIVVTGCFIITDVIPVQQIGLSMALAILLDATLVRLLLVPAFMKLLGSWNWWNPFAREKA